jgi:hypothetical protein
MPMLPKKYIIQGRIPGDDDDTVAELTLTPDECPVETFIEKTLYDGNIPADWQTRPPTKSENRYGEWAYIQNVIELE